MASAEVGSSQVKPLVNQCGDNEASNDRKPILQQGWHACEQAYTQQQDSPQQEVGKAEDKAFFYSDFVVEEVLP